MSTPMEEWVKLVNGQDTFTWKQGYSRMLCVNQDGRVCGEICHTMNGEVMASVEGKLLGQYTTEKQASAAVLKVLEAPKIPPPKNEGQVYGIIDPEYGRVYTVIRLLAWMEGYAVGLHGSFSRDLDLIAVPWTEHACDPEHLIRRIIADTGMRNQLDNPGVKPHGRRVWTLLFPAFADPRFVDLSILPRETHDSE